MGNLEIQKKISTRDKSRMSSAKVSSVQTRNQVSSPGPRVNTLEKGDTCRRCGGFMVSHWCMNVNYDAGGMEILTKRCLQCGEVIDPVILENRLNPQREELKKKTRPLLSRPLASSKSKSSGMSCMPLA